MRNVSAIPGAFWSGEYGFVCEDRYRDVDIPGALSITRTSVEKTLASSGALPGLHGAPVASWFLARVAFLSAGRFPFSYGQVVGSDGADYCVRFYCMVSPATPSGVLSGCGSSEGVSLGLRHPKEQQGERILDAFHAVLLERPSEVARCRVVVQYTEMTDPEVAFHIPRVYGWDGKRYLNEQSPEHAIDPSEYQ